MRKPIDKFQSRVRTAYDQRHVLEDKYVRREMMRALEDYAREEHDYAIGWTAQVEYKQEREMVR